MGKAVTRPVSEDESTDAKRVHVAGTHIVGSRIRIPTDRHTLRLSNAPTYAKCGKKCEAQGVGQDLHAMAAGKRHRATDARRSCILRSTRHARSLYKTFLAVAQLFGNIHPIRRASPSTSFL